MRRTVVAILGSTIVLSTAGCVPQEKYDNLLTAYRTKEQQLYQTTAEMETMSDNEAMLRDQLKRANGDVTRALSRVGNSDDEVARLRQDYEAMLETVSSFDVGPLPAQLNQALVRLASQHSDMLTYDEQTGMLRFSSDFTFDLGKASLSSGARNTLKQLAGILNSTDAAAFETQVVGHTDNVPIRRPATKRDHPTNTHLSVHRAISVRDALVSDGVQPNRVQVAGYGEYRPIAPNGKKGAAANRRVEIYLVPMGQRSEMANSSTIPSTAPTATVNVPTDEEPIK